MNKDFQNELNTKLAEFNIKYYQYSFFDRNLVFPPDIISTYPQKWLNIYQNKKLYNTDPIVNYARITVKPFSWHYLMQSLDTEDNLFFKLAKKYGIHDGYTFAVHDALGHLALLNITCDDDTQITIEFLESKRAELLILLVDLFDLYLSQKKQSEYYRNKIHLLLSSKEKQVLKLGCDGLIYKDIAESLGIAERTVKFHMSRINRKLDVSNAKKAFLIAKDVGVF